MRPRLWFLAAILGAILGALMFAGPAAASIVPGAYCAKYQAGTHQRSAAGKWYVCSEDTDSTVLRWHPADGYTPPPPTPSVTPTPTDTPSATPTPDTSLTDLPTTGPGGSSGPVVLARLAGFFIVSGGLLLYAARLRRKTN